MKSPLDPTTASHFDLNTREGRMRLFNRRIDQLMAQKHSGGTGLSLDEALFEMRTGGNADDVALLDAMGETTSSQRTEKLQQEKFNADLTRIAEENAKALKTSEEVKAALATSERRLAFNARIDELTLSRGFTLDQAINQMRANAKDAALLKAMDA